jgi:hypothetical protein
MVLSEEEQERQPMPECFRLVADQAGRFETGTREIHSQIFC